MRTIAITGATGFVGRALVDECLARGGWSVRVMVRKVAAAEALWGGRGVEIVAGDLRDAEALDRFLVPGATLVHLAYLQGGRSPNLEAMRQLAAASRRAGVRRIVHCSTAAVIGPGAAGRIDENVTPDPRGAYQSAKLALEHDVRGLVADWAELAILRPTEIIGPRGQGLRSMIERLRAGRSVRSDLRGMIFGARRFNYVCIRNVVAGLLLLAEVPLDRCGEVYYMSDDDDPENNYAAVEERILQAIGRSRSARPALPLWLLSLAFRLFPHRAPPDRRYSTSKIRRLGYEPVTTLADTIEQLVTFELGRGGNGLIDGAARRSD